MQESTSSLGRADLLLQSVRDYAIYMLDPQGHVASWNAGAERLKGYRSEEIIGQHFSRFYSEDDRQAGVPGQALAIAVAEGRLEAEGWHIRKDGSRFWANVVIEALWDNDGRHVGFAKITRDLSERRETEEALRRSEERFRLLVQNVTDYAIYMLDPQGHIASWNAGAERFKGYTADEVVGQHFSCLYLPEDRQAGLPQQALQTAEEEGRFETEGWRLRKDGSRFWANVVIDPIYADNGRLIGFTKITRDLTERKRAREALEESREQFFQSQKMEAIGQLTGGVAHDFNNILAAIMGSLDLAQRRLAEGRDVARFLDNALEAAQRGATLTQRMLAFARKQELQLEPIDLVASIRGMTELLARTIGPGIAIKTKFPPTVKPVMADSMQLELALMNLVVNARDAMPDGGTVMLTIEQVQFAEQDAPFIRLAVTDEGHGMDEEDLSHALEPFFTTKGLGKGTGLGLPMVQGMAEQCGGRFNLLSELGKGTTAEILLPVADQAVIARSSEPAAAAAATKGGPSFRILTVDDDPIVLLNTATLLADMGHEVLQAHSAPSALRLLSEQSLDLLITDYAMPGMTGAELVEEAGQMQPGLKAIIVSGYADLPEGAALSVPRLPKPFKEAGLAKLIATVMKSDGAP